VAWTSSLALKAFYSSLAASASPSPSTIEVLFLDQYSYCDNHETNYNVPSAQKHKKPEQEIGAGENKRRILVMIGSYYDRGELMRKQFQAQRCVIWKL
jgi:hypothetical protein